MEREWERKRDVRLGAVQRKMYVFEREKERLVLAGRVGARGHSVRAKKERGEKWMWFWRETAVDFRGKKEWAGFDGSV